MTVEPGLPRRRAALALAVALPLAVAFPGGCDSPRGEDATQASAPLPSPAGITVTDSDGRSVHLPAPAGRIVSLVPSATLSLDALGAGDRLVARTDHDTATWTAHLPSVGGGLHPSLESVVAARPDLVIRFGGPQDLRTPGTLDELGIPHVAIRPDGIDDIMETLRLLGAVTGRGAAADSLVATLESELARVRAHARTLPPVRTAYVLGGDPPWVAGPGTYIDEILSLAGGVNAFRELGSLYASVSLEEFVARDIQVVLTPDPGRLNRRALGDARVQATGDALELPGPGVAEAAWRVFRLLHPDGTPP